MQLQYADEEGVAQYTGDRTGAEDESSEARTCPVFTKSP